eukprot:4845371-Heterocapsa_arctica.AAC.1
MGGWAVHAGNILQPVSRGDLEAGQDWGHQPMGSEGGHGEQCRVEGLQQGEQLSRDFRGRTQDFRSRARDYRNDRFCTHRKFINDDRSNQHQLAYSRLLGVMQ